MRVFERYEKAIRRLVTMGQPRGRQKRETVPTSVEKAYPDESYVHFSLYKLPFPGSENCGWQGHKQEGLINDLLLDEAMDEKSPFSLVE
jgi:hypothetical protein